MNSLLISGISGQVGSNLAALARQYNFNLVCGIDRKTFSNVDCPIYKSFSEIKENVDIIIDFSSPSLTDELIDFAQKNHCKLVCGTTGLIPSQICRLKTLSEQEAVCYSNNFSRALLPFLKASRQIKEDLLDFQIAITEFHNKKKKDFPSGTAKTIAEQLNTEQVFSVRGGNVAGVHTITFLGDGEEIELTHRVYDKSLFAKGALEAAKRLIKEKNGLFCVT